MISNVGRIAQNDYKIHLFIAMPSNLKAFFFEYKVYINKREIILLFAI